MRNWSITKNGNYDYLMYADLDFKHPEVIQNIYDWADWFMETLVLLVSAWMPLSTLTLSS